MARANFQMSIFVHNRCLCPDLLGAEYSILIAFMSNQIKVSRSPVFVKGNFFRNNVFRKVNIDVLSTSLTTYVLLKNVLGEGDVLLEKWSSEKGTLLRNSLESW